MTRNVQFTDCLFEDEFNVDKLANQESLYTQGNGYMGIRGAFEEEYLGSIRGFYVAGTYNKDSEYEVSELPNLADILNMDIFLDGEMFRLDRGEVVNYNRRLCFKTGEILREIVWESESRQRFNINFKRFVSQDNLHLVVSQVEITPQTNDCQLTIKTGFNGRANNSGTQNMHETEKRVIDNRYMVYSQQTTASKLDVVMSSLVESQTIGTIAFASERRKLFCEYSAKIAKGQTVLLTKKTIIHTSLDHKYSKDNCLENLKTVENKSYDELLEQSINAKDLSSNITIKSKNNFDQLAINFAAYHLNIMAPRLDNRVSIGAKGLTGEGYKAHVFWDTEVFLLPYYLHNDPQTARKLLEYRYINMKSAKEKATRNGYDGTLYPWESALTGEEETPEFAALNIKTGTRERVHSADKEHHIVADIAYSVLEYEKVTGDKEFMQTMGLEMLIEASKFWISRADKSAKPYKINDVIGPDEYTEHINNNAYTNYMAFHVVSNTYEKLLQTNLHIEIREQCKDFIDNLYLPKPTDSGVIPQDDTFLDKPIIDLTKYRKAPGKQLILQDYSRNEVVNMQILKQADAVMLLYTLPNLFDKDVCKATWNYYEPKTIHDSSLSMSIHSIVALSFGDIQNAYECFEKGCRVDIGEDSHCSDGVHAASLGAIYLSIVFGFAGLNVDENGVSFKPQLPNEWEELSFSFKYKQDELQVNITKNSVDITKTN